MITLDCNLTRPAYDQPWYGVEWFAPRYAWHLGFFAVGNVVNGGLRATGIPPLASAITTQAVLNLAPHVNGAYVRKAYPVDLKDWTADGIIRSGPMAWSRPKRKLLRVALFTALYLSLAMCWANP